MARSFVSQNPLRAGAEELTDEQRSRFDTALWFDEDLHLPVYIVRSCARQLHAACRHLHPNEDRRITEGIVCSFPIRPIPEIDRLDRTVRRPREVFLVHFTTNRSNNGGAEAIK